MNLSTIFFTLWEFGDYTMTICERLFALIAEKNLKVSDMCKKIGVNTSTTTNWKQRNTDPPSKFLIPICEFLGVTLEYLLTGTDNVQDKSELSANDKELLNLFRQLPERNQIKLIGYVERMIEELFGEAISSGKKNYDWVNWDKIMNEKPSVAADESLKKTGTTNSAK